MPVPFSLPLLAALGGDEGAGVRVEVRALEGAVQGVAVGIDAAAPFASALPLAPIPPRVPASSLASVPHAAPYPSTPSTVATAPTQPPQHPAAPPSSPLSPHTAPILTPNLPFPPSASTASSANSPDIIVTADRYGAAVVASESELQESEIASHGSGSIGELLERLAPLIGDPENQPVILINGRPAGLDQSILSYPPEALARLAVLRPEAAGQYGEAPGRRVVNLVLKRRFAQWNIDAGAGMPWRGGRHSDTLSAGRVAIAGETRWNAQLRYGHDSALRKSDRVIPRNPEDDRLLALGIDPQAYETLSPASQRLSANLGVTRPLGAASATVTLIANRSDSESLRGVARGGMQLVPPATGPVMGPQIRPLKNSSQSETVGATATVNGSLLGWRGTLALGYTRSQSRNLLESDTPADVDNSDRLRDDGLITRRRNRARADALTARFSTGHSLATLATRPVMLSLSGSGSWNWMRNWNDGVTLRHARQTYQGQAALALPLLLPTALGEASVNLTVAGQQQSGSPLQTRYGVDVSWSLTDSLRLRVAYDQARTSPSGDQLDAPSVTSQLRLFDYATQQTRDVIWMTGGNPDLRDGRRQSWNVTGQWRPLDTQAVTLNLGYRRSRASDMVAPFPDLTPAIEAAYRERIRRDASGMLISIDARPIMLDHSEDAELTGGLTLRWPNDPHDAASVGRVQMRYSLTLGYTRKLVNRLVTHASLPVIDQLRDGGQSRDIISLQGNVGRRGLGLSVNGGWGSAARITGTTAANSFRLRPPVLLGLSAFVEPAALRGDGRQGGWFDRLRITVDVQNLLGGYRHMRRLDGSMPTGATRDEVDPIGRVLRISVQKRF